MLRIVLVCFVVIGLSLPALAQEKNPYQFGKVTPEDFKPTSYSVDSAAAAVILADVGQSEYDTRSGDMEMVFKRYSRIHILRKSGYDAANVDIHLFLGEKDGKADRLEELKAVTYNLENGEVVATKLDSRSVFTEREDGHWEIKKFSMPAVKEGSIIEISYTRFNYSDHTPPRWDFQGYYPRIWSQYTVSIPQWYSFVFLRQGYYDVDYKKKDKVTTFAYNTQPAGGLVSGTDRGLVSAGVTDHIFVAHNLPGMRDESFTTTLQNHISRIEFQLASVKYPNSDEKKILATWPQMAEEFMKSEDFGASLSSDNFYLEETIKKVTANATTELEKARALYYWVQHNISCTDYDELYLKNASLKQVFTSRKGNSSELNILLVAMLKQAGLESWPLILSTRSHGKTYENYPIHRRFNYTIAWVRIGEEEYNLDASLSLLGFGKLPLYCYNGPARLLSPEAPARYFSADSLKENSMTSVNMELDSASNLKGTFTQVEWYQTALNIRTDVRENGKDAFFKKVQRNFSADAVLHNMELKDLDSLDKGLTEKFEFEIKAGEIPSRIYLTPMMGDVTARNPFTAMQRSYPVEMPYVMNDAFTISITLPDNYEVEELPKPASVKLSTGDGLFRYYIQQEGNLIQMRVITSFTRANFPPEEYEGLRSFYDYIVKKETEQIVLKKK